MTKLIKLNYNEVWNLNIYDRCYYFGDYYRTEDMYNSENHNFTNTIRNFKKPIDRKNKPEWQYKEKAIKDVSNHIINRFTNYKDKFIFTYIPTSKTKECPDYDDRLDKVMYNLKNNSFFVFTPIHILKPYKSQHEHGHLNPKDLKAKYHFSENLEYIGEKPIILF